MCPGIREEKSWPYVVAGMLVFFGVVWVGSEGFVQEMDAHFEWNSADGFESFILRPRDNSSDASRPAGSSSVQSSTAQSSFVKSMVQFQIQPILRGYFKLNDWPKMNGSLSIRVMRIIPIAWPVDLGSGGETLEDPDETALMRAAVQGDAKMVKQLLASADKANINALDQGGQSALILACENPKPNPDIVKQLIAAGANVNLRSRNGYTALTWALARKSKDVSQLLRRAGSRP